MHKTASVLLFAGLPVVVGGAALPLRPPCAPLRGGGPPTGERFPWCSGNAQQLVRMHDESYLNTLTFADFSPRRTLAPEMMHAYYRVESCAEYIWREEGADVDEAAAYRQAMFIESPVIRLMCRRALIRNGRVLDWAKTYMPCWRLPPDSPHT